MKGLQGISRTFDRKGKMLPLFLVTIVGHIGWLDKCIPFELYSQNLAGAHKTPNMYTSFDWL